MALDWKRRTDAPLVGRPPQIQRLVTPLTLQRKRARVALKKTRVAKSKEDAAAYHKARAQPKAGGRE